MMLGFPKVRTLASHLVIQHDKYMINSGCLSEYSQSTNLSVSNSFAHVKTSLLFLQFTKLVPIAYSGRHHLWRITTPKRRQTNAIFQPLFTNFKVREILPIANEPIWVVPKGDYNVNHKTFVFTYGICP